MTVAMKNASNASNDAINRQTLLTRLTQADVRLDFLPTLLQSGEARLGGTCALILLTGQGQCCEAIAPGLGEGYHQAALTGILKADFAQLASQKDCFIVDLAAGYGATLTAIHQQLVAAKGLKACWSMAVFGSTGQVVGLFLRYGQERRSPTLCEQEQLAELAALAGIALERQRLQTALEHHEATLQQTKQQVRKQTALALQNLVAGTATTGSDFFAALVKNIAAALGVTHAIVTEKNDRELTTLGFWADGQLMPAYKYNLNHTPCEFVFQRQEFYCSHDVQQRFPLDQDLVELKAECYLGIALTNTKGEAIGHLYILHQQPLSNPSWAKQILQVFAARAAVELERQQAEAIIKQQLAVMEVTIDGIGILKEGQYLYVNQAYVDLFGYGAATELIDRPWTIGHSATEAQRIEQDVFPLLHTEQSWQGEAIATRKDGSTFYVDMSWTVTEDQLQIQIYRDITNRKKAETALQNLIAGTAALTGSDFFPALVHHIAEALEASHVFVTKIVEGNQLYFVAAWGDDEFLPNMTVDLDGTTCAIALQQGIYHCQENVIDCFPLNPRLAEMRVESYMGVALLDRHGKSMGTLCMFSRSRLADPTHAEQVLRIFAARASAELERQRAETSLQSLIAGTAAAAGPDIFTALTQHIAESIPVSYAMVSAWSNNKLSTLAFWANGTLQDNLTYDPVQTPCELTLQRGKFFCEHSVQAQFPNDLDLVEMKAESYLGIALKNAKGR